MFDGSDVVNYGSEEWGDDTFCTFSEWGLLCTGKWFAGEVVNSFILQFVIAWFPEGCSSF